MCRCWPAQVCLLLALLAVLALSAGASSTSSASLQILAQGQALGYDPTRNYDLRVHDIGYRQAGSESWLVRIYEPQGTGPFPLLLDVHAGAWVAYDRLLNALIDGALAASGMVVAAIDFRQAPRDPYPASVADVNYATRWLKVHAVEFKADPRTIGGCSAPQLDETLREA